MTVIVYRDRVLAADTAAWAGKVIAGYTKRKIQRLKDGTLIGMAGDFTSVQTFTEWAVAGFPEFAVPSVSKMFAAVVISPDGKEVRTFGKRGWCDEEEFDFTVIGAEEFCRGALAAGADARRTIALAIAWHDDAGGEVHWLALDRSDLDGVQEPEDEPEMVPVAPLAMRDLEVDDIEEPPPMTWRQSRGLE